MANMFSNKVTKPIPKTLSECTKPDPTASNLHIWAERLERWGQILFWFFVVAGIILSIAAFFTEGYYDETAGLAALISTALNWALSAFIEYCAYHVLALLIDSLACIVQNTNISVNVALYTAKPSEGEDAAPTPASNPVTVSGKPPIHRGNESSRNAPIVKRTVGPWSCSCGQTNADTDQFCKNCGKFK